MDMHLQREINRLKTTILAMSTEVSQNVREAVETLVSKDKWLARKVIESDVSINHIEVEKHRAEEYGS